MIMNITEPDSQKKGLFPDFMQEYIANHTNKEVGTWIAVQMRVVPTSQVGLTSCIDCFYARQFATASHSEWRLSRNGCNGMHGTNLYEDIRKNLRPELEGRAYAIAKEVIAILNSDIASVTVTEEEAHASIRALLAAHVPNRLPLPQFVATMRVAKNLSCPWFTALKEVFSYEEIFDQNLTASVDELHLITESLGYYFRTKNAWQKGDTIFVDRINHVSLAIEPSGVVHGTVHNFTGNNHFDDTYSDDVQEPMITFTVTPKRLDVSFQSPHASLRHVEEMGRIVRAIMSQIPARLALLPYYESIQLDAEDLDEFDRIRPIDEKRLQEYPKSGKWYEVLQDGGKHIKVVYCTELQVGHLAGEMYW